jgi:hypothetical protein
MHNQILEDKVAKVSFAACEPKQYNWAIVRRQKLRPFVNKALQDSGCPIIRLCRIRNLPIDTSVILAATNKKLKIKSN